MFGNILRIASTAGWSWYPSVLIGVLLLAALYRWVIGPLRSKHQWGSPVPVLNQMSFYLGCLILVLALCSPLDTMGDESLFSMHMVQHVIITFFVPVFLLLGLPKWLLTPRILPPWSHKWIKLISSPIFGFLVFSGAMWIWHIPALYDYAVRHEAIHVIQHLTLIAAAVIGWAPALIKSPLNQTPYLVRGIYLILLGFPCTALAAWLTFSAKPLYPFYVQADQLLQINPLTDQQLGGLLMWLPGDMMLMIVALYVLNQWLSPKNQPVQE